MQHDDGTADYRRSNKASAHLVLWTGTWAATLAVARFGPELVWDSQAASWAAVAANLLVGVGWIVTFIRFVRAVDDLWSELIRDALGVTLGVGWVVGFGYLVADGAGLVTSGLGIAVFPVLLGVVYLVTLAVGWIRYR